MHLKIKPNPDMVFTGQPELLARLVWDRDFGDSSWLSYKNTSRSWANTLINSIAVGSQMQMLLLEKETSRMTPSVFPNHSWEDFFTGYPRGLSSHGWPWGESVSGRSCSLCPRARFSTTISMKNSYQNQFSAIMSAGKETEPQAISISRQSTKPHQLQALPLSQQPDNRFS